jgi:hypothetical protein
MNNVCYRAREIVNSVSGLKNTHYLKRKRCAIICMKKGGAKNGKRTKLGGSHKAVYEA